MATKETITAQTGADNPGPIRYGLNDKTALDLQDDGNRAVSLLALTRWIEGGRQLADDLANGVTHDVGLKSRLKAHSIRYGLAWSDRESDGLCYLMQEVDGFIRDAIEHAKEDASR